MTLTAQIAILLLATALVVLFWTLVERNRRQRLSSRRITSLDTWCEQYYGAETESTAEIAMTVISVVGEAIGIHPTQLRPTDRLDSELALPQAGALDDTAEVLEEMLSDALQRKITIEREWRTLDDIVHGVVSEIR